MQAIVLVGGEGTRLRPLTLRTPKPLVPVLHRPLLDHLLLHLKAHGVTAVTLAMTARSEAVRAAFEDGARLGIGIDYAYEDTPLGSGGAIASIAAGWSEPFLVCNGDIVTDLDVSAFIRAHRDRGAELSIALFEVDDPSAFGVVALDASMRITRFVEKPRREDAPSHLINAGCWLFEPHLLREMDGARFNRVEDVLFPALAEAGRAIVGFRHDGYWVDVGNPEAYRRVNLELLEATSAGGPRGLVGAGTLVAEGATVARSVIGARCAIEAGAAVTSSVLWDDIAVGAGATVVDSVLASGARIEAGAHVDGAVVGHGATVARGTRVPPGTTIEPDVVYAGEAAAERA